MQPKSPLRYSSCHPDRVHHMHGRCRKCHAKWYRLSNPEKFKKYRLNGRERILAAQRRRWRSLSTEEKAKEAIRIREYYDSVKEQIYLIYGSRCSRCGFEDKRALQLDHIRGGGRRLKHKRGKELAAKICSGKLPREDFQLLCANCNWIKRWENNECKRPI